MPSVLVATVGSASANSYVTSAEADAYFDDHPRATTWSEAAADDRARALLQAARVVDLRDFRGTPVLPLTGTSTGATQALKWPRYGARDDEGWTYESTVVPGRIQRAQMELALAIIAGDYELGDTGLEGFDRVELGPLKLDPSSRRADRLPTHVRRELAPLLELGGSGSSFLIQRA